MNIFKNAKAGESFLKIIKGETFTWDISSVVDSNGEAITSADYVLNERLNVRLFYDQTINEPFVSSSFPTSNTNIGLSLRFTISQ